VGTTTAAEVSRRENAMVSYDWECVRCHQRLTRMIHSEALAKEKKVEFPCPECGGKMVWKFPGPVGRVR